MKAHSRQLRREMTDAEQRLWYHLRRKQIAGVQFYRQKPLLNYIVDFYSARAALVIELDGSQHFEPAAQQRDHERDAALKALGLRVLRFDDHQVMTETGAVVEEIYRVVVERMTPP